MAQPQLASFKYSHDDEVPLEPGRRNAFIVTLAIALVVAVLGFPVGLLALIVPLIVYLSRPKKLYVGPRYLICGRQIVYYANVVSLTLEGNELRVQFPGGAFVLERERFPTNARKPEKIAFNKDQKFSKVAKKIISKVQAAAPDAELIGIAP